MPMIILAVVIGVVVILGGWLVAVYNSLVGIRNRTQEAFADIDVQLKRRYDLIPNLVETVKGYASHERETLEKVIQARTAAMSAHDKNAPLEEQAKQENMLSETLKSIFALSESYPDLKANTNFLHLQQELADTENKIQASRRFYNGNVRDYSTKLQVFPNNIVAGIFGFKAMEYFEAEGAEKENVKVQF